MMIALMERAAYELLADALDEGQTSVGTHISVEHTAASPVGAHISAKATITSVRGRKIEFYITANDGKSEIGIGKHTRVIVDEIRFMEKYERIYMKNKIILVGGYCAAGKSTFARKLSQELNIPCFEKDKIDETMCDGFGSEIVTIFEKYKKGSENVAFALMLHITELLLQTDKMCILESAFSPEEIDKIKITLEKYNGKCLLFVLKGDPEVMFERYVKRDKSGECHWIHKPGYKNWFEKYMPASCGLEGAETEEKIIVDTTSFDKVNYDDLIAAAKRFISAN